MPTMSKRRKTYIAHMTAPAPNGSRMRVEVLAYTEAYVRAHYEAKGYTVHSVKPKPRRRTAWRIDEAALAEAIDFFGLQHPVFFDRTAARRSSGAYSLRYSWALPQHAPASLRTSAQSLVHSIRVKPTVSAAEASRTLWHELCHAAQAERALAGGGMGAVAREVEAEKPLPYRQRPSEIEAREAEEFHHDKPLTIPA